MPRRPARALIGSGVAVVALVGVLVGVPAAYAAPVPVADRYTVHGGGTYTLTPIANDTKSFLTFGDLSLCGVADSDTRLVYLEQVDDTLVVEVRRGASGTTTIDYEVCQGNDRATGTITLSLVKLADVRAVKRRGVAGRVDFTNPNRVPVRVTYGSATSGRPDATVSVRAGGTTSVSTRRPTIYWVAQADDNGQKILAGDATLTSVQSRR